MTMASIQSQPGHWPAPDPAAATNDGARATTSARPLSIISQHIVEMQTE